MLFRIIQFSDIHIDDSTNTFLNASSVAAAISTLKKADKYTVVTSGDIAFSGQKSQYDSYSRFLKVFFDMNTLPRNTRHLDFVHVPGNHDIDYSIGSLPNTDIEFKEKYGRSIRSSNFESIEKINSDYTQAQAAFFKFAEKGQCLWHNPFINKKILDCGEFKIGFVMINSAVFSLMSGENADKGCHRLTENVIEGIRAATSEKYNVLILHHGLEWFTDSIKRTLRNIISDRYVLVLTGHEHDELAESRIINNSEPCLYVQANAFYDLSLPENGFCTIDIDTVTREVSVHSFIRHDDIYINKEVCNTFLQKYSVNGIRNTDEFLTYLKTDQNGVDHSSYYYFPSVEYYSFDNKNTPVKHIIRTENELYEFIIGKSRISISGDRKYGKTLLAKRLYLHLIEQGFVPVLFDTNILKIKKNKLIEYVFCNQFLTERDSLERFKQLPVEKKVAIIDDADLMAPNSFNSLLDILNESFGSIIVFHRYEIQTNIHEQVLDAIDDELKLEINPFWYSSRKGLISNLLEMQNVPKEMISLKAKQINDLINKQIKYFNLNPEFIINFVKLYEQNARFQFTTGKEAFSMVYENSIKTRIIANSNSEAPEKIFIVLHEIAYYMHFNKKQSICIEELIDCIKRYNKNYRQNIIFTTFIEATKKAEIISEHNNTFSFTDKTHLAYFVARAINMKASDPSDPEYENVKKNFINILDNLCFGINSDIILFLSLITNSPLFINIIIQKAEEFFADMEELCFSNDNISFISNTRLQLKDTTPNEEDKQKREEQISEMEKQVKEESDIIEAVDEYDYSEEDLLIYSNMVQKAFKYLEIVSKALPAFCTNMRIEQQDKLVDLIYRIPNKFLFLILKDINEDYDTFINTLYEEALKKRKSVTKEVIKTFTEQFSAFLIISIYDLTSFLNTSSETIGALNAFADKEANSNYDILNLMFNSRLCNIKYLHTNAINKDKKYKKPIEKSIIKFIVREYYMRNDVSLHGDGAALSNYFFGPNKNKELQIEMARNKLSSKKN